MSKILYFFVLLQAFCLRLCAAEGAPEAPPRDQGFGQTIIMIAIALIFFYLILWRPEQKRRKTMELQRSSLKKGDRVTAMGIIGTVVRIQDHTVVLRMVDGSKIEMLKAAISEVMPGGEEEAKPADDKAEGKADEKPES
jgi:preprotein translocase subunit YajC